MSSCVEELNLLERVFLRLGSTETDQQLENVLDKFLPPVLLKLSSPHEEVRKKVMDILTHINKRLKTRPEVQLPVEALLNQYKDPEASSFVTNFSIIYIKLGLPRLSLEKQYDLFPAILSALQGKPQAHIDSLLSALLPVFRNMKNSNLTEVPSIDGLDEKPELKKYLLGYLLDVLLLPYSAVESTSGENTGIPPAMSEYSFKRVTTHSTPMTGLELEELKIGIVKFISQGNFKDEDIILPLTVASSDTRCDVGELADGQLRKIDRTIDWTSSSIMSPIYKMFLGSQGNVKQDQKKSPASVRQRIKLYDLLIKGKDDGIMFPMCVQVIFDSLYGKESHRKLKNSAMIFIYEIIKYAKTESLGKFASIILQGLQKYTTEGEDSRSIGHAYILIGRLAQKFPNIVYHDLKLLEHYMSNLENQGISESDIRTGFLELITAYKYDFNPDEANQNGRLELIFNLAKGRSDSEETAVRFVVVKILANIFPPNHVPSKFLLLKACGDIKEEVSSEAYVSLYGTSRKEDINLSNMTHKQVTLPSFTEFMQYIENENKNHDSENKSLPYSVEVFKEVLIYTRLCLIQDANVPLVREIMNHPCDDTPIIAEHLRKRYVEPTDIDSEAFKIYLKLCRKVLISNSAIEALSCLVEAIGCLPQYSTVLSEDIPWIQNQLLSSNRAEVREFAAILYGLLLINQKYEEFEENIKNLIKQANHKTLEVQHGALLAIGNCLELRLRNKKEMMDSLLSDAIYLLNDFLTNSNALLSGGACDSLGTIGSCTSLPIKNGKINESPDPKKPTAESVTKACLVIKLLDILNDKKLSSKLKEKAAHTLGSLCVGEKFPHTKNVLEGLLETAKQTKDVEVHFTIGESLVMCIQSIYSSEARNKWIEKIAEFETDENDTFPDENLDWLLSQLLKISDNTNPNSRQASSIWLLAIVKSCGKREPISKRLDTLQNTFLGFLAENNDIVQDVASKGLCVFYDTYKSEELLSTLVRQLTTGARQVQKVSSDTKLFEDGQLGSSPSGGNLTTYKELCSLASDLNKPDLVYQFMNLANHNSMWNSKKGAAFGFSTIAQKCGEELKTYLPDIVPKLYRYQYDPSPRIQNSMVNIWKVLVSDNQKVVEEYFQEILKDLLEHLNSGQYRVRQSCCRAICDLLKSSGNKSVHDAVDCMNELWTKLFRVMDDHHEETRVVAKNTAKNLSKLCVQACAKSQGEAGVKMIQAVLPPMLEIGITSKVLEIRLLSLSVVEQLVDSCGEQLRPFLPTVIPALLRATQDLESVKLSYLSTRLGGTQSQELLDEARASMVKSYVTIETITKCMNYIDTTIFNELVPNIIDLMKNSMALATRIGCAHCVELLVISRSQEMQPYSKKLISALTRGLKDRNIAIRKQYARTIGFVAGVSKESALEKLIDTLDSWYLEAKEPTIKTAVAYAVQAISRHSSQVMKEYSHILLPLIFFAMHDEKTPENASILQIWEELWSDNTPGSEAGIRQNLTYILDTIKSALASSYWMSKAQAANAIATMANKLGSTLDIKNLTTLIDILLQNLEGRTWNGKEKLLKALSSICTNCKDLLNESEDLRRQIAESILKQSRKDNIEYKVQALKSLGDILSSLNIDKFDEVYKIVKDILIENGDNRDNDDEDLTAEEILTNRENKIQLKVAAYEALGKSWISTTKETQEKYRVLFVEHCVAFLPKITRVIQVSVLEALYNYVQNLKLLNEETLSQEEEETLQTIIDNILLSMEYSLGISKFTRLRKEALNIILSLLKKLIANQRTKEKLKVSSMFNTALSELQQDTSPEIKSRIIDIRKLIG